MEAGAVAAIHVAGVVIVPSEKAEEDNEVWEDAAPK